MEGAMRTLWWRWGRTTWTVGALAFALAVAAGDLAYGQVVLKFAHNQSPKSIRHEAAELFAKRVAELSGGGVKIEIFPGGVMGPEMGNLEGLKIGSNHFAAEDPGMISSFDPTKRVAVLQLPYLFETYEQAWAFMDSEVVRQIFEPLASTAGFRLLAVWENGIRHLTNSKRPIQHPRDLQGLKVRTQRDPVIMEIVKSMGASPVPMAFTELYTAMQHGVVDGQENPIANIYFAKFNEVQKYLSLSAHQYGCIVLLISEIAWKQLSPDQQEAVRKAADEAKWFMRKKTAGAEEGFLKEMTAKGLVVNRVDTKSFREAVTPVYKHFEPVFGQETIQRVLEHAAAVRAKHPSK